MWRELTRRLRCSFRMFDKRDRTRFSIVWWTRGLISRGIHSEGDSLLCFWLFDLLVKRRWMPNKMERIVSLHHYSEFSRKSIPMIFNPSKDLLTLNVRNRIIPKSVVNSIAFNRWTIHRRRLETYCLSLDEKKGLEKDLFGRKWITHWIENLMW